MRGFITQSGVEEVLHGSGQRGQRSPTVIGPGQDRVSSICGGRGIRTPETRGPASRRRGPPLNHGRLASLANGRGGAVVINHASATAVRPGTSGSGEWIGHVFRLPGCDRLITAYPSRFSSRNRLRPDLDGVAREPIRGPRCTLRGEGVRDQWCASGRIVPAQSHTGCVRRACHRTAGPSSRLPHVPTSPPGQTTNESAEGEGFEPPGTLVER
jgi:hypothetical protein